MKGIRGALRAGYRTLKPAPVSRPMSLERPMKTSIATSAKPTMLAPSITRRETGSPRIFSTRLQKMWPPSSGRNREKVDQAEREAEEGEQGEGGYCADPDLLVGNITEPDNAGNLLAVLGVEDVGDHRCGFVGDQPHRFASAARGGSDTEICRRGAIGETDTGSS